MTKFEIYRADINKVLLVSDKKDAANAFGEWASAAMISGFIKFTGAYEYVGDDKWNVRSAKGKEFVIEVRAI